MELNTTSGEYFVAWLKRILSFREDENGCLVIIGNVLPYNFIPNNKYNPVTRTLTYTVATRFKIWLQPSAEEKKAAQELRIYYSISDPDLM